MTFLVTTAGGAGSRTAVREWHVASSADVGLEGLVISQPEYDPVGWLPAPPRSTVLAALVANGQYPDVYFSTNMRDRVDPARFGVPWWFRTLFTLNGGGRTHIRVDGVIPRADLWVNGHRVLDASALSGAYVVEAVDVTHVVGQGSNALALLVHPGNPMEDLSIGWVDWAQPPPDDNMGPWRDVTVERTGDVRLGPPHVVSVLPDGAGRAHLSVTVEARNLTADKQTVIVAGTVTGHGARLPFRQELALAPGAAATARFGQDPDGDLVLCEPAMWWPVGEGPQSLYHLAVTASTDGVLSDQAETDFGVREIDSDVVCGGGREFRVNGRAVQILGAGWSPDLLLRHDQRRMEAQLALTAHMGLNAIRPEGKLENPEFYDLCDRLGIMVLPGWECCTKWEAAAGKGGAPWDDHDAEVAARSIAAEAELLRNHPSVIAFLIGSDFAPPAPVAERYVRTLEEKGWQLPVVASATTEGTDVTGPSGMKMTGPYDWVPPAYWYERDPELGGAVGFNSETSAGHTVPRLPSLRRMLSTAELDRLWQQPELPQYHSGPPSVFDNLGIFARALAHRYGGIRSLDDFVAKAQLASYEAVRAQFEAFASRAGEAQPATGVVYWMLTAPWPSLNWQLFDYELDTPGSYFGARKALERLHVFYAYDTETVRVLNRKDVPTPPLSITVRKWRADGSLVDQDRHEVVPLGPGTVRDVVAAPAPAGVTGLWFLELEMHEQGHVPDAAQGGAVVGRNVYWLSTAGDVLDRDSTDWYFTGVSRFADLRALSDMGAAHLRAEARASCVGAEVAVSVTVQNDDARGTPAVGVHASVARGGAAIAPVLWDDNDVTLFSGQSVVLRGRMAAGGPGGGPLRVRLEAFNLHRPLDVEVREHAGSRRTSGTATMTA